MAALITRFMQPKASDEIATMQEFAGAQYAGRVSEPMALAFSQIQQWLEAPITNFAPICNRAVNLVYLAADGSEVGKCAIEMEEGALKLAELARNMILFDGVVKGGGLQFRTVSLVSTSDDMSGPFLIRSRAAKFDLKSGEMVSGKVGPAHLMRDDDLTKVGFTQLAQIRSEQKAAAIIEAMRAGAAAGAAGAAGAAIEGDLQTELAAKVAEVAQLSARVATAETKVGELEEALRSKDVQCATAVEAANARCSAIEEGAAKEVAEFRARSQALGEEQAEIIVDLRRHLSRAIETIDAVSGVLSKGAANRSKKSTEGKVYDALTLPTDEMRAAAAIKGGAGKK
ncbi:MAG: hypothetical protein P0S95_01055 [Rhabdochlamydiaceae bacterium]|nr:hypothetical protein [Candidatus Amphrikana amoebophyrae]